MNRRAIALSVTTALILGAMVASAARAAGPVRHTESYTDRFFDDFIFELCGIETYTTVTERWTMKEFADGSAIFHANRLFVSDDPRIPIEMGAGTSFIAPDGTKTTVGSPTRLFTQDGHHLILVDAGRVVFGDDITARGHVVSLFADLADYYCP